MIQEDGYSEFFSFLELTDSKKHPELVANNREYAKKYINSGKRLSKLLETTRHILGDRGMITNSGCRDPELNTAVGSIVPSSSHTRFEAADVVPIGMSLNDAFRAIQNAYRDGLLPDLRKVIIEEGRWLHIEVSMSVGDFKGFFTTADGVHYEKVG
jgi:hypothetical protein